LVFRVRVWLGEGRAAPRRIGVQVPAGAVDMACSCAAQVLWTFSIYLEAVAILPQLVRMRTSCCHDTTQYVACLPPPPTHSARARLMCTHARQVMLQNSGNVDNLTGHYVFFLGCVPLLLCGLRACALPLPCSLVLAERTRASPALPQPVHSIARARCDAATSACFCPFSPRLSLPVHRAYRALYLLNWIFRYFHEPGYRHWIGVPPIACGARAQLASERHTGAAADAAHAQTLRVPQCGYPAPCKPFFIATFSTTT
jgi:hypothetical protein